MRARIFILLSFFLLPAHPASADWLFTPFIGSSFGTTTTFVVVETGADTSKLMFGGSAALLSRGVFGVEADFGYGPRFFERDKRAGDITGSNVTTLTGNVIIAVPLSVSRESLRPYVVGGLGLIHAAAQTSIDFLPFNDNMLGSSLGGGAIGLISPRSGFRFELRHLRSLKNSPSELTGENGARLSFWRATVGVIVRLSN
jgi:hypothetical protein